MSFTIDGAPDDNDTQESARYRCLWLAVILRAKSDTDGRDLSDLKEEAPVLRRNAETWLCATGGQRWERDLKLVCEYANVDPDKLIELSRRRKYGMSDE